MDNLGAYALGAFVLGFALVCTGIPALAIIGIMVMVIAAAILLVFISG